MSEFKIFFYAFCGVMFAIGVSKWEHIDGIALAVGSVIAAGTVLGFAWILISSWLSPESRRERRETHDKAHATMMAELRAEEPGLF